MDSKEILITLERVKDAIEQDRRFDRENPLWNYQRKNLPSRVNTLNWIHFSNTGKAREEYYARALMEIECGQYISREAVWFDTNQLLYRALINK